MTDREFKGADGDTWSVRETGSYFGAGARAEGDSLPQANIADVEFASKRTGRRVHGTMARGQVERATDDQLRERLDDADLASAASVKRDLWWAVDCPNCHVVRLLERELGRRSPPGGLVYCGNANCRTGIHLEESHVYLFDRRAGSRVDPDSLELDE